MLRLDGGGHADDIYLDGNSLGPPLPRVRARVTQVLDEWEHDLIGSWNTAGWVDLGDHVAARIAPLIAADADEVAVTDSTTVNLFQAVVAAARLRPDRSVLLVEQGGFPTDTYVVTSVARLLGLEVRATRPEELDAAVDDDVAVVVATAVDYRTGRRHDERGVTAAAHRAGALIVWDLSHSAGAVPVDLSGWGADLAVGCTYKYLNGGPGSPAYVYAARRLHTELEPAVNGWWGHAEPFAFADEHRPARGARRFANGTPPILSLAALDEALTVWDEVDLDAVLGRSAELTQLFIDLVDARCPPGAVEVVTPRSADARGAQVSLRHPQAYALVRCLADRGVVGDHRPPDLARFGFAPLYVRRIDVWDAVDHLRDVLTTSAWRDPRFAVRRTVT